MINHGNIFGNWIKQGGVCPKRWRYCIESIRKVIMIYGNWRRGRDACGLCWNSWTATTLRTLCAGWRGQRSKWKSTIHDEPLSISRTMLLFFNWAWVHIIAAYAHISIQRAEEEKSRPAQRTVFAHTKNRRRNKTSQERKNNARVK